MSLWEADPRHTIGESGARSRPPERKRLNPRETALRPRPISTAESPWVPPIAGSRPSLGRLPLPHPIGPGLGRGARVRVPARGSVDRDRFDWSQAPPPLSPGRRWLEKGRGRVAGVGAGGRGPGSLQLLAGAGPWHGPGPPGPMTPAGGSMGWARSQNL